MASATNQKQIKYLVELQSIDDQLFMIEQERGSLPQLIAEYKEEIDTLKKKIENSRTRIEEHQQAIAVQQENNKVSKQKVKIYEAQQKEAKNDQEFEVISNDLELERLEVLLTQKRVKDYRNVIATEETKIVEIETAVEKQMQLLLEKERILEEINKANRAKEEELHEKREKIVHKINVDLYNRYGSIKGNKQKVVVNIARGACAGCFIVVPEQVALDVKAHEKIISCENCSRFFAKVEEVVEELPKTRERKTKKSTKKEVKA